MDERPPKICHPNIVAELDWRLVLVSPANLNQEENPPQPFGDNLRLSNRRRTF